MADAGAESLEVEEVVALLRARVERRRLECQYPPDLEEALDQHFQRVIGDGPKASPAVYDELEALLLALQAFEFDASRIDVTSTAPGRTSVHRTIGKLVSRQIAGALDQAQHHADLIDQVLSLVVKVVGFIGEEYDGHVAQLLGDLQARQAEQHRALRALDRAVNELTIAAPGGQTRPWYRRDRLTAAFRGTSDDLRRRYRDLADELVGCAPVLDIGFGRGELLELLADSGVQARGIEADPDLVLTARARGLDVEEARAIPFLARVPDGSLGGVAMIQVIEHLPPQEMIDIVRIAGDKVRSGGKVIVESTNPNSLSTFANTMWTDPDRGRPVDPAFLEFLFGEAGFSSIRRTERSPVPEDDALELLPGDDESVTRLNDNFRRLNSLLFAPRDYAVIATR